MSWPDAGLDVIEVSRPNRQVRRRHGKTDVVDAIAAARAVVSGQATATAKAHAGPVEALLLLKIVQRSATQSRTQAANQLRNIVATAPDELQARLRALNTSELVETCAAFRVRIDDDSVAAVTRLAMRELAQRIQLLDERLARTKVRLRRITTAVASELVARKGVGPDTASTILVSSGDNPLVSPGCSASIVEWSRWTSGVADSRVMRTGSASMMRPVTWKFSLRTSACERRPSSALLWGESSRVTTAPGTPRQRS